MNKIINRNFLIDQTFFHRKINLLIEDKKYFEAEKLLDAPIKHSMHSSELEELKEKLYSESNNTDKLKDIYLKRINTTFRVEVYNKYKTLAGEEESTKYLRRMVDRYSGSIYLPERFVQVLSSEGLDDGILKLVKNEPSLITRLYDLLSPKYDSELNVLYKQYIYSYAKSAYKRSLYKKVCILLKKYNEKTGLEIESIIADLRTKYKRRTALMEELDKVFPKRKLSNERIKVPNIFS